MTLDHVRSLSPEESSEQFEVIFNKINKMYKKVIV
jgi:hypothetical protein